MSITHLHSFIQSRSDLDGGNAPTEIAAQSDCVYLYPQQSTITPPAAEILDLERTIREIAQSVLVERKHHLTSFVMERGRDIPCITAFRSDWYALVAYLLKSPLDSGKEPSTDPFDSIRFELNREARAIGLSFSRCVSDTRLDIDHAELGLIAARIGTPLRVKVDTRSIELQLKISVNSGIIAPELRHSEERISRMHVHANGNQLKYPTSIIKNTG